MPTREVVQAILTTYFTSNKFDSLYLICNRNSVFLKGKVSFFHLTLPTYTYKNETDSKIY